MCFIRHLKVSEVLTHWPLVLEVTSSIPAAGEKKFQRPNMLSLVLFAGMTLDKCAFLQIGTLTGGPLCRESHPMCRLKNPTVAFILQNRCVQCTPAHYPREILRIGTLTEAPLCRESHSLCMLKNPIVVYMIICRLSFCKTGEYNVCLIIIIERGCSSMYR